jgi:hypothetical protein
MKIGVSAIVLALFIVGCSDSSQTTGQESSSGSAAAERGSFSGNVDGKAYALDVDCSHLDQDFFMFKSDRTDATDSDGDGLVISGMQNGAKFVLTIIDNGQTYSTGNLATFEKSPDGAQGSGTLWLEDANESFPAEFSVLCR